MRDFINEKNASISFTFKNTNIKVLNEYIKPKEINFEDYFKNIKKQQNNNKLEKPYYNKNRW